MREVYAVIIIPLACAWPVGCIDTATTLENRRIDEAESAAFAQRARQAFAQRAVSRSRAERAFELMRESARATLQGQPERLERLAAAASFAIWLARHGPDVAARGDYAEAALVLCNTAIHDAPQRVEGYYYRAVATGLYARENTLYGPDAMAQIRDDARRAIEIDPSFAGAGPHRVLGGLYLHAPGPPAGVGSLRRAVRELEAAVRIAPDHPGNLLFLCSAYLRADRLGEELTDLLERLPVSIARVGDEADRVLWSGQLSELQAQLALR